MLETTFLNQAYWRFPFCEAIMHTIVTKAQNISIVDLTEILSYRTRIPSTVTTIRFSGLTNWSFWELSNIHKDMWPPKLLQLRLGRLGGCFKAFEKPFASTLFPSSLTYLHLGNFNYPIPCNSLPLSLTTLHFGCKFNQPLKQDMFPSGLISLKFGKYFNQPIQSNVLPDSLVYLKLGLYFNQTIFSKSLPSTLHCIKKKQPLLLVHSFLIVTDHNEADCKNWLSSQRRKIKNFHHCRCWTYIRK